MSKITRYNGNLKAFASEATGTERTIFGDTAQSDTLDANITLDLLRGWGVIGVESNPTKQHFNGLAFTLGQLIAYLHQQGVPEWNAAQEYYAGSVVTTLAGIYRLKSGGVGSSDPDTDGGINWELIPTQAKVDAKADQATTYTETEVDGLLNTKADQATTYTETEVDELTGSLAYPNTTLASSSDIPGSLNDPVTAYPHIQGFRTGTGTARTFAQVVEEAAERGARLLTIQELEAGVAAGTGYIYNDEITWTSSPAGVGLVYGNTGDGDGTRVVLNTNTDTAAGGYAVSVVGQNQWTETQYADKATTYTETEVDGLLDDKANISGQIFTGEINYRGAGGDTTNTGYGENVLQNNTEGHSNTANGRYALADNTEGHSNTANGRSALAGNTTGSGNTANGRSALFYNTTGSDNTANGYNTGRGIETGSGNSIFGANITGLAPDLTDNLILASGGVIRLQHDGVGTTTVQGDLVADNLYTETEVDELTGSLAYPNTTLASSSDISEDVQPAIAEYPHIQGFRTGTGTDLTFAQAVEEAAELGARLLTIQELEAGVAAGAGFAYDTEITWTSSPAGVGLVYGNLGKGNGTRVVLNTNTDTAAGGYAVSVVGQRQWADTQYADQATTYTETEVDGLLDAKAAISGQAFSGNISAPNLSGTNTGDQTLSEIGVGQTWQDVSGSRAQNTNYTNSTGKPIMVSIVVANGSTDSGAIIVDSVGVGAESNAGLVPSQFIVPNGSVYLINSAGILAWSELR